MGKRGLKAPFRRLDARCGYRNDYRPASPNLQLRLFLVRGPQVKAPRQEGWRRKRSIRQRIFIGIVYDLLTKSFNIHKRQQATARR